MVTRNTLPQDYIDPRHTGTLFEGFQTTTDWTVGTGAGTIATNTTNYTNGTQSVKVTLDGIAGVCGIQKTINVAGMNLMDLNMVLDVYLHDDPTKYSTFDVYFSSMTNLGKYMNFEKTFAALNMKKGWNHIPIHPTDWTSVGADSWANTMLRVRFRFTTGTSSNVISVSYGALRIGQRHFPKCLITFDAGYASGYTEGIAYCISKGIKGTMYLDPDYIDITGRMTSAQLATAYNAGWAASIYPTKWHTGEMDTQSQAKAELLRVKNWLDGLGYTRASAHVGYPYGQANDYALAAMAEVGIKTGRSSDTRSTTMTQFWPPWDLYNIQRVSISSSTTLATAKNYIDTAVKYGIPVIFIFHTLTETPSDNDWSISNFQAWLNYGIAKRIDFLAIDELCNGLTKRRTVSR